MGREIRRVPVGWEHPKVIEGDRINGYKEVYMPMSDSDYQDDLEESRREQERWFEKQKEWQLGYYTDYNGVKKPLSECFEQWAKEILREREIYGEDYNEEEYQRCVTGLYTYTDFDGEPPGLANPERYMPSGKWWQLYENVSEGTPLSPAFETSDELVDWLSNHEDYWGDAWTREAAEHVVSNGYVPSMVIHNDGKSSKIYTPKDMHLLPNQT